MWRRRKTFLRKQQLSAPYFEIKVSTWSVVYYESYLPEPALGVRNVPIELDGQVGVEVGVPRYVYEIVRLFVHLVGCYVAGCGGDIEHPFIS